MTPTAVKKSFQFGEQTVTLETGKIARQASGAVLVNMNDTVVLVTVVGKREEVPGRSFLPLTVNYQERTYAAGKIPGGFFKREGRPSEKETLVSRLIDRPIRPLFPAGFSNEVQVIATVISMNPDVDADIPAMLGTSAALAISGIPFEGPIGAARVGYRDGGFILNPTFSQLEESELDLVVAGTEQAVLMVESEAERLSEQTMLDAVLYGHEQMQAAISAINELAAEAGKPRWDWTPAPTDESLAARVGELAEQSLTEAYGIADKQARQEAIGTVRERVNAELVGDDETAGGWTADAVGEAFKTLEKRIVRGRILGGEPRIDGRDQKTVRPIDIEVGTLPRTHGSAIFTRGETQAIVVTTLGTGRDAQIIDAIEGERREPFMLHYNFPPYSVGEAGRVGFTSRREVGHGRLARRGLAAVLPGEEEFPYTIRLVSEITESNGSSSMASVCVGSLALMTAGVPIKAPVAGIAMGLVKDGNQFAVLTDILGDEDHLGDMDFKVAGTEKGITSLQMDIKVAGITPEIMQKALAQAKQGRLHILGEMNKALDGAADFSVHAPRIETMTVPTDKIREVIGSGGKVIREIVEVSGAKVDINDEGVIKIASPNGEAIQKAYDMIHSIVAEPEEGHIYKGTVVKIVDFGAFVNFFGKRDGLVHVSQIENRRLNHPSDVLKEGQEVWVKLLGFDDRGKVRLSMKVVDQETGEEAKKEEEAEG